VRWAALVDMENFAFLCPEMGATSDGLQEISGPYQLGFERIGHQSSRLRGPERISEWVV
jgi:hypothetical protein